MTKVTGVTEGLLAVKPNAQILEEASSWFVEFAEGEVTREGREAHSRWLKASPEHVRAYLAVSATFDNLGRLDKHRTDDAQALIDRILAEGNVVELTPCPMAPADAAAASGMSSGVRATSVAPRRGGRRAALAAAAIATIALALGVWQVWFAGVYATGIGEQRVVNLADGSTLELDADTRVRVRLSDHERLVDLLEGQALFHVAKDPQRPFIVRSDTTRVRGVWTQFDGNRQGTATVITVLEGRVAVARATEGRDASTRAATL